MLDKGSKEVILQYIKNGKYISDMVVDVHKIFSNAGMELYAKPCCARIAAAGLVDEGNVSSDYPESWNLRLNIHGMDKCSEILGAYLQPESLKETRDLLQAGHDWCLTMNNILYEYRKKSKKELLEEYKIALSEEDDGYSRDSIDILKAELSCRKFVHKYHLLFRRSWYTGHLIAMYHGPARFLIPFIKEAWAEWENNGSQIYIERNGRYGKALKRFMASHGRVFNITKLRREDLVKYVYLAVKFYGRETPVEINHTRWVKDCREIDKRYKEYRQVLQAIGRLTPSELEQMYPVIKEYDGEKWGSKDYFYTMDKLRRLPVDNPIGDENDVACLLWDYQNADLEFIILYWQSVLGDLSVYCDDNTPYDKFRDRLLQREAQNA